MLGNRKLEGEDVLDTVNRCICFLLEGKYREAIRSLYRSNTELLAKLKRLCMNLFFTDS